MPVDRRKNMAKKKKLKVAIQGIATSFHEVAALTYFDEPLDTIECLTFVCFQQAGERWQFPFSGLL